MPVMDGFQATAEIRRLLPRENIHIVALTSYTTKAIEEKCLARGMDQFLTKPVCHEKLSEIAAQLGLLLK